MSERFRVVRCDEVEADADGRFPAGTRPAGPLEP
ncbi:hypothetical protein Gocc_2263 [Gaiella occulta]|uniref:Uncharacterized protein n=1 Tax=Gaiella occulta TaxID=1002870 RepID=A0A7M2YVS1_9ACTN|nr:hypothetical protein Gocc_2263 [Gaiella occulta]